MTEDPFPRERVSATLHRVPAYGRLAFGLAMDPRLAKKRRAAVVAAAGYLVSPVDLVPGIIPVLGQLDDIAVALAALRFALAGLDAARRAEHLAAVGLADSDLAADVATLGAVSAWSVRAGVRTGKRAAVKSGEIAAAGAKAAAGAASAGAAKVSPKLREAAAPIAKRAADATPQVAKDVARDAGARVAPAARQMSDRLAPVAKGAASRLGNAARATAGRGATLARRAGQRSAEVTVSTPDRPLLADPSASPGAPLARPASERDAAAPDASAPLEPPAPPRFEDR